MIKSGLVSTFLSRANIDYFSRFIESNILFSIPYKFIAQRLIDFDFPQHIFIEVTNACNLKCEICSRNITERKIGFMDLSLFRKIVDEASLYGRRSFCLHIFGEPLLAPNIAEMIGYIKSKNCENAILLTTNGVLLSKEISDKIIDLGVDRLVVSVMSAKEDTYASLTGRNILKNVEENVINFIALKKNKKNNLPVVYVRMIKNEKTAKEADLFISKWSKFKVVIDIRDAHNYAGKINYGILEKNHKKRYPCYHLWFSPAISYDGDLSICCCDWAREAVLGNIKNVGISEIWHSEKIALLRSQHLKGDYQKIPLCDKCDVWRTYPDIFFNWQKEKDNN